MTAFGKRLRRIRRQIRLGQVAAAGLAVAGLVALLWLLFGLADIAGAFEPPARVAISWILLAISAATALVALGLALRVPARAAADAADAANGDLRRSARSALTLDPAAAPTPLGRMLAERTLDDAATALAAVPASRLLPRRALKFALLGLSVPLVGVVAFRFAAPEPFAVVAERLRHPHADLPPYSPLRFALDPAKPTTVYGGEILLAAEITGGELEHPVQCLVRQMRTGEVLRLPAFRESETRFSRKLDGLTEPIEIAFACGKARSRWQPVEILLEPTILSGLVRIAPPDYTGLAATEFPLDTNEIAAIEGSRVTLELTSNRPLGSAVLTFTAAAAPGSETEAEITDGAISGIHTASFTWTSTRSGELAASLRDLRGTPTPRPLELAFRALPDRPPSVALNSPPRLMLATPDSKIPVSGTAEDDHALSKVRFVRTLSGFRDRARVVAPALRDRTFEFDDALDLAELGLEAGQTIELMLEASDHNPSLLGQASSEIARIQIISEEQYAEYIRARTTLERFTSRFRAARDALDAAREALEKLRDAAENDGAEATAEAAGEARRANEAAADLLGRIAEDFPAFELEERLRDLARRQVEDLRENAARLEDFDPADEEAMAAIEEMLRRLGRQQAEADQLQADVEEMREVAALLEMAAKFRQIYETQASVAKRFGTIVEELRRGEDQNRRLLPSLGETQEKNRAALDAFKPELQRRAEALADVDPAFSPLAESALDFLNALELAEPETLMDAAATAGHAGNAAEAFHNAELARALLERLLSEPGDFQQAVMGQAPRFDVPRPDVERTLAQLLEALLGQNMPDGAGEGSSPGGSGFGLGGTGGSGSAMPGIGLDLPVAGPQRTEFDPLASRSRAGDGTGRGGTPPPLPETAEAGRLRPTETRGGEASGISPENIPEPYREAVKRYFTPD